jgi:hypothetical protein
MDYWRSGRFCDCQGAAKSQESHALPVTPAQLELLIQAGQALSEDASALWRVGNAPDARRRNEATQHFLTRSLRPFMIS